MPMVPGIIGKEPPSMVPFIAELEEITEETGKCINARSKG